MTSKKQITPLNMLQNYEPDSKLIGNIIRHIEEAKSRVAGYANSTLVVLYWQIGYLINQESLKNKRAEYGAQILSQMAQKLTTLYGNGFDFSNLSRMVKWEYLLKDR